MNGNDLFEKTQARFLKELRHHLQGWLGEVSNDLSEDAFQAEIASLQSDPVYTAFGLDTPEYALVRMMGRLSISIGRRLGEIYDKMPRFVTQGRFNLEAEDVAPKMGGKLELDVCVPLAKLTPEDQKHVAAVIPRYVPKAKSFSGVAIEIRYNFNPNDSSRLGSVASDGVVSSAAQAWPELNQSVS